MSMHTKRTRFIDTKPLQNLGDWFRYMGRTHLLRLANVIGPRSSHGVVHDLIAKIASNPKELEVLGDRFQEKSYIYITDCVEAIIRLIKRFCDIDKQVDIYNIGSNDKITIREIATIVSEEMKVPNIKLKFTGGVDGGRGWKGDIETMQLSINKLLKTGWRPKYTSREAVKLTAKALAKETLRTQTSSN